MKNTIKMSLVAALAVAGFSTTASAGGLEEAIKGVSIGGKMEVEYDYSDNSNGTSSNTWDLDWDVTAKIPVNDQITAVFGAEGDTGVNAENQTIEGKGNLQVTKVYFQYANGPVTAMVGKQGIGAPWFDDERANGVKVLANVGPVTLAAAHFTGANANANGAIALGQTDISAAAVIGSFGPVNAQLWYANLSGITSPTSATADGIDADSVVLIADMKFDIVNVGLKYGTTTYDNLGAGVDDDAEMIQAVVSADFGAVVPYAGMGMTDKEQAVAGLDLTSDTDSQMDFGSEQLSIDDLDNATAYIIGATVPMGAVTLDASYVMGDYDASKTVTGLNYNELLVQADYKMSKNFTIGAHYSMAELDVSKSQTNDMDAASVSLEYKF